MSIGVTIPLLVLLGQAEAKPEASVVGKPGRPPIVVTEQARLLHQKSLVMDGHNDLPWVVREKSESKFERFDIRKRLTETHTDIPRLREGNVGAVYFAAYVPTETIAAKTSAQYCLEQIELIHRMVKQYPETFRFCASAEEIEAARHDGKIAALIGIEGGHAIENSLDRLRQFHQLGVRYMTLTHSSTIDWADSATDKPRHNGLTPFGEDVVREMNRLGMQVDLSHVSPAVMRHALRVSRAPVIASHSSAYAIAKHPRNVPDDVLEAIARNDGVVMVNFFSGFIVPEGARQTQKIFEVQRKIEAEFKDEKSRKAAFDQWRRENPYPAGDIHTLVDHIDHIVRKAGINHVGLGSDFDGITKTPAQLSDVACYPNLTQALLDRGYRERDIQKILGGNSLRVLRSVADVAKQLNRGS